MSQSSHPDPLQAEKIFCIGMNKTGTTSLAGALKGLGYNVGDQPTAELLLPYYLKRDFKPIIDYAFGADAFQDAPFSYPFTFMALDQAFPNAKFILSVRDSPDQWYRSLVTFHGKIFAEGRVPVKEDLQRATYRYPGFVWDALHNIFNTPEDDIYNKAIMVAQYENHNYWARDYFRMKDNFVELNLSQDGAYLKMCAFLGRQPADTGFPWLNKT
jgi:hypothetical protein